MTGDDRIEAIDEFQRGDAQVCIAQIKAAGIAVTLTAASEAVFVQCDWSAGDLKQCADRILRVDDITEARAAAGERITWHVLQAHYADGDPTFDAHAGPCSRTQGGRLRRSELRAARDDEDESVQYEATDDVGARSGTTTAGGETRGVW